MKRRYNNRVNINDVFGGWTVLSYAGVNEKRCHTWICRCNCGFERIIGTGYLRRTAIGGLGCRGCKSKRMQRVAHSRMWEYLKKNSKIRGKEFNLDRDYLFGLLVQQDNKCALTGIPIHIAIGARNHQHGGTTASVDRMDNTKGYVYGNIQWLHKDVNRMKWILSTESFIEICRKVIEEQDRLKNIVLDEIRSGCCLN